ncbi:hypothetical protein B0H19DRAFT_1270425 [Mycena capillaripes]|nr:hypothetical protein B0H19DRAFT_1270425 [Mycena capillaripes]
MDLTFKGLRRRFRPLKNQLSKPTAVAVTAYTLPTTMAVTAHTLPTTAAVTAYTLLPQELWDEILDCLAQCPSALLASALVCRALVGRAQMLLFRSIYIATPYETAPSIEAKQLAKILTRSPHLVAYICELSIGRCDEETLAPIVHLPWSHLSGIQFARGQKKEKTLAVDLITAFVSLPTIHQLSFRGAWDKSDVHTILASCNRGIFKVNLWMSDPPTPYGPPLANNSPRLRITHLDLCVDSSISDFIVHSASPLDLSHLTHLKYYRSSPDAGLDQVLHIASRTIQSLEFWCMRPVMESLDLGSLPALSHITLCRAKALYVEAIARARTLRTIFFYIFLPEDTMELPDVEAILLAADMPALQKVELQVYGPYKYRDPSIIVPWTSVAKWRVFRAEAAEEPSVHSSTELMALVKEKMPRLMERGILDIHVGE